MSRKWSLGFDGALFLQFSIDENISTTSFYKLSLKRYVKEIHPGFIRFNPELNYLTFNTIVDKCKGYCNKVGTKLEISPELDNYVTSREIYIEKRYRLGNEIKARDEKLNDRFKEYSKIVNENMDRKLRPQQMWDSFFMFAMRKAANFSVPGSGKTSSVLGVYAYLNYQKLANRIVVICPKNAFGSWIDEFNTCFKGKKELKLFNIHDEKIKSTTAKKKALKFDTGDCNLILINYESLKTYYEEARSLIKPDTLLVYDEVHKVKRVNGENARFSVALAADASATIVMTGTPIPNGYIDIYNFLHIMFPNEYNDFFNFNEGFLKKPNDYEVIHINDKLQPFFCRTTKDQLGVPAANPDLILINKASEQENELLKALKAKYGKNKLALLIRLLQLESNPKLLLQQLDLSQFKYFIDDSIDDIEDIEFEDYSGTIESLIDNCSESSKFLNCLDKVESIVNENKTVIMWCIFKDTIDRFAIELNKRGIKAKCIYGEVSLEDRLSLINGFKNGDFQVLITNPHTLAESVSLHGVCHDAIYFEYSYNLVHLLQSKDRIHRLGLPQEQYTQYYFMQNEYEILDSDELWSLDKEIYERLQLKEKIMLEAIANHKLEIMPTSEEDLDMIFSKLKL